MRLREWIAVFVMVMSAIGMWCLYVVKMQQMEVMREFSTIEPMDLTVTYCRSCDSCNSKEDLDALEFEACLQEDLDKLDAYEKESACQL